MEEEEEEEEEEEVTQPEILLIFRNAEVCYITLRCTLPECMVHVLGSLFPTLVKDWMHSYCYHTISTHVPHHNCSRSMPIPH